MGDVGAAAWFVGVPLGGLIGVWAGLSGYSGWPIVVPLLFVILRVPLWESLFYRVYALRS